MEKLHKVLLLLAIPLLVMLSTQAFPSDLCIGEPSTAHACKACSLLVERLDEAACCKNANVAEKCRVAVNGISGVKEILSGVGKDVTLEEKHSGWNPDVKRQSVQSPWKRQEDAETMMSLLKEESNELRVPRQGALLNPMYMEGQGNDAVKRGARGPFTSFSRAWYKGGKRLQRRVIQD